MGGEHADLLERVRIEEQVQALASGQLALRVLLGDGFRASHRDGPLPSRPEVVRQLLHPHRAQPFTTAVRYVLIPVSCGEPLIRVIIVAASLRWWVAWLTTCWSRAPSATVNSWPSVFR